MSHENDPFDSQPYVPPHRREGNTPQDASDHDSGDTSPGATGDAPRDTTPQSPDHESTVEVPSGSDVGRHEPTQELPHDSAPSHSHRYADRSAAGAATAQQHGSGRPDPQAPAPAQQSEHTTAYAAVPAGGSGDGGGWGQEPPGTASTPAAPKKRRGRALAGVLALVLLAGAAGIGGAAAYDQWGTDGGTGVISSLGGDDGDGGSAPEGQVERVAANVLPSVTQINVAGGGAGGSGTGIIISSDGEILTNNHVVEAAADDGTITVGFSDGTNAEAEIVGRDPKTDLAVIKAEGKSGLQPATLGSSNDLTVGQEVVAIGSPFGLESTVTSGIVSALNRPVASSDGAGGDSTVFPAVQTDAAINPGNSGGPLVDLEGRVVGINSAIRSGTSAGGEAGSIGLGFSIPVDLAESVAEQLREGRTVEHAQIGVTVRPAVDNDEITGIGAEIVEVADGSAGGEAGLQQGDVITSLDDVPVGSSNALVASIRAYRPGDEVTLTFQRDGESQQVDVTLDSDGGNTSD
ncbi:trypsin-like peptidase domain-containing protein [Aeromicrobium sp. CF4.19]|uniref:S1C family serine protease n=1 Tax=Aeromicrobium sp. CF4.19 TaxID=3373082 RepID=UPI003EE66207